MEWFLNNVQWIFSGIGVFALGLLLKFVCGRRKGRSQSIKSGDHSTNIQIGGDANNVASSSNYRDAE